MILWFLPLIGNFRKKYFPFFVFTALNDPIGVLVQNIFETNANLWIIINGLLFLYFFDEYKLKSNLKSVIIIALVTFLLIFGTPTNLIMMLIDVIIMVHFIIELLTEIKEQNNLNLFVFVIISYELTIILTTLFSSNLSSYSEHYFVYTFISMFAFAIFFTFTNEKSKFLQVNINKYLAKEDDD